ncbi:MAG TPA: AAA family ATPase [Candidatus Saccharimonadales bacterium]|jgi:thymidylate kinase|nr:AAA family ATPase [Candidatus Saccharimonadales bacterium]
MGHAAKLIVIRGPSGAGKSTIAKLLHERVLNKTALVDQDYYRHVMFNNLDSDIEAPRYVMFAGIAAALEHGYDVIVEGFMGMGKYRAYCDRLLTQHPTENYFFYLDVSFEETERRHGTRSKSKSFGTSKMRELYARTGPSGYPNERIVSEGETAQEACRLIIEVSGVKVSV